MLIVSALSACIGSSTPTVPEPSSEPDEVGPSLTCPDGTSQETSVSEGGTEVWCDKGGIMHGPYLRLYPNGQRAAKGAYDNNLADSDWIWWHENGAEASKGKYVRGKQTGQWTWWHDNGVKAEDGDFLQGRKAGQWVSYYESGAKKEEGMYHNSIKDGLWTFYEDNAENSVLRTELWEQGSLAEEHLLKKDEGKDGKKR
ncbi:MAG: hypothetical protein R3F59_06340 [Myxococcota bacterium]